MGFISIYLWVALCFQDEGGDGGPGGESPAAADGDHEGDAGGSTVGERFPGEEGERPQRLGR